MKISESTLRKVVREETQKLVEENRDLDEIVSRVLEMLQNTRGVSARKEGEREISVGDSGNLYFQKDSPIHLSVQLSDTGVYREFSFDFAGNVNIPSAIMDRIEPFIT